MEQKFSDYLTDEELLHFIKEIETSELLTAPSYLKNEILETAAFRRKPSSHPLPSDRLHLAIYSLKVAFVAAAAITCLFLIPSDSVAGKLSHTSHIICNHISDLSNRLMNHPNY